MRAGLALEDPGAVVPTNTRRSRLAGAASAGVAAVGLGFLVVIASAGFTACAAAPPLLAPGYGDNMVLKTPLPRTEPTAIVLWGWVPEDQRVTILLPPPAKPIAVREYELDPTLRQGQADWRMWSLLARDVREPLPADRPFAVTVRRSKSKQVLEEQTCTNVLVGQVWALWIRRPPGTFHAPQPLPPEFRVLRAANLAWGVRGQNLAQRIGATGGWRVPASDPEACAALPDLLGYAVPRIQAPTGGGAGAVGIVLVHTDAIFPDGDVVRNQADPLARQMESALSAARDQCNVDNRQAQRNQLRAKRRGLPTGGELKWAALLCPRIPKEKGEFLCELNGVLW